MEGNQYGAVEFTLEATFEIEYQVTVRGPDVNAPVLSGDEFQILSESDGEADFEAVSDTIATDILDTSVTMNLDAGEYRLVVENAADLPEAA